MLQMALWALRETGNTKEQEDRIHPERGNIKSCANFRRH